MPAKELYPKLVSFLADDIEEPVVKQYLDTCKKMRLVNLQIAVTPFFYHWIPTSKSSETKGLVILRILFCLQMKQPQLQSNKWSEHMCYFDENSKSFCLDFLTLQSISSTKSEVIIDKIKEVLSEQSIDLSRTWFVCFDGTNAISGEKIRVQRRYWCEATLSIYVNCGCHRLALCFKYLVNKFSWLSEIDKLL